MSSAELLDWPVVRSAEEEHAALFGALNNLAGLRDAVLAQFEILDEVPF